MQDALGHASPETTRRYATLAQKNNATKLGTIFASVAGGRMSQKMAAYECFFLRDSPRFRELLQAKQITDSAANMTKLQGPTYTRR